MGLGEGALEMMQNVEITDMDELVEAMRGLAVVSGGHDGVDGIHFELSDGRYLVITGVFVVGLCRVGKESIN